MEMSDRHLFEHLKRQDAGIAGIASNHLGLQTGFLRNTVDGSEIRHQLIFGEYPSLFVGFFTSQVVGNGISEPSTV